MDYRTHHINSFKLLAVAVCATALIIGVELSKKFQKDPLLDYKLTAARLMQKAMDVIKKERSRMGLPIERKDDPNETGLIGKDYTDLTTTLGSLSSKRTSTNPNFTGVLVEMLFQAGVKEEDVVAISLSGSFPALNIALLSTVYASNLKPVIISSVGASMYGANEPQLTWLDMERILRENGVCPYISEAASLGGLVETKGGLDGSGIEMGLKAIRRNGIPYLHEQGEKTLKEDIERRLAIYERALGRKKPAVYINIGGTLTSLGNCPEAYALSTGLLSKVPFSNHPKRGIIFRMSEEGVPIIHLLNIKKIAARYGLPVDPIPLPVIPSGSIMQQQKYSYPFAVSGLILLCLLLVLLQKHGLNYQARK